MSKDTPSSRPKFELFTDGACSGNPGPGGWAFILRAVATGEETEASGGDHSTTNNRMELTSVIEGLDSLGVSCDVELFSDSQYVIKGLSEWMEGWKARGWKNAAKKPVKNRELWEKLDFLCARHDVTYNWVKGHSDHRENERCDLLAVEACERYKNGS